MSAEVKPNPTPEKPLLFISHRHEDSAIADVVREFVTRNSMGKVKVAQSSSPAGIGPRGGRKLTQELRNLLWEASVLILLYTEPTEDWQFCMWECGVATHPDYRPTDIYVFQCMHGIPKVFEGEVSIDPRNPSSLQSFVNSFLTSETFFPGFEGLRMSDFPDNSDPVKDAARELHVAFQRVLPMATGAREANNWPTCPYINLVLTFDQLDRIEAATPEDRKELSEHVVEQSVAIEGDSRVSALFGRKEEAFKDERIPFAELLATWKERCPVPDADWCKALSEQMLRCAQEQFPPINWQLMRSSDVDDPRFYGPNVARVRTVPSRRWKEFHIYFTRFNVGPDNVVKLSIPGS